MQEKGCTGFVSYVVDVNSIFLLVGSKIHKYKQFLQVIIVITQPACVFRCFLITAKFQPHVSYRLVLIKKHAQL